MNAVRRSKVPQITLLFWVIKALTTGMGETSSDFLAQTIDPPLAVMIGFLGLVGALALQIATPCYNRYVYWLTLVMVSIFGTMAADVLHVGLAVPYIASTLAFAVALAAVFWLWHRVEGTLAIHSIRTRRREAFYWAAVLTTFALGTAAGDMTATSLKLGYLGSGLFFAALFSLPGLAFWRLGLPEIPAFWTAYVLTRPLGASFADWMGVAPARGGLGWGTGPVSLCLGILILVLVGWLSITSSDVEPERR